MDNTKDFKITRRNGAVFSRLRSVRAGVYNLSSAAVKDLANDPEVAHISLDHPLHAKLDNTAGAINASAAWTSGFTGANVGVALIDSGINGNPDLGFLAGAGTRIVYVEDFTQPNSPPLTSVTGTSLLGAPTRPQQYGQDLYGHGQHLAGIIGGNGSSSTCSNCTRQFIGTAPGAKLLDLRVLDQNGESSDSTVIAAIDRAIELKDSYNVRVINLSLGRPVYESYTEDPLCQAVEAAWKAGIVVVVSAGNDGRDNSFGSFGYGTISSPANDPYVITVGAMKTMGTLSRTDDLIASYSSKGPTQVDHIVKPDILAPGNLTVSLQVQGGTLETRNPSNSVPLSYYQTGTPWQPVNGTSPSYFILSGTSMAAGVVSGAVADLLQAQPNLTPDQVKLLLMGTAYKTFPQSSSVYDAASNQTYTSYYDIFTVGAGYLDLGAALTAVNTVPTGVTAMSPVAVYDSTTGNVTLTFDPSSLWGQQSG